LQELHSARDRDEIAVRKSMLRTYVPRFLGPAALLIASSVSSAPHVPSNDATVLERLPAARETRALAPLRAAVRNDPKDLTSALQLARAYLELGRSTSDPRFVSYALATLGPWLQRDPPVAVLVLQATALQNLHRFDEALGLLDRALALDPNHGQAWLTKATLLQVRGDFAGARIACQRLLRSADPSIALACLEGVDSLTGKLDSSYASLLQASPRDARAPQNATDAWIVGLLAEMAERRGDAGTAEAHFKAALRLTPDDIYLLGAYADLLLLQGRDTEVIALLRGRDSHDVLLLRLAIAGHRTRSDAAHQWSESFDARRRAARPDDNPHEREHARFALDVLENPQQALELARANWRTQREPADLRIYARAAQAAASAVDLRVVKDWLATTGYEDRTLTADTL
jgi:tetratricopeptide (TPR) repeat protein